MVSDCYRLAGAVVRVDWADGASRDLLGPALAHRLIAPAEPALVIRARAGEHFPNAGAPGGLLVGDEADGLSVSEPVRRMSHRLDAGGGVAEFACETPAALPGHERAAPFRLILQAWLQRRGTQLLHAAAVGLPGGAVLLAAPSGGGKSNTTLACLASPLQLLGEDYVAVDGGAAPSVWSLYGTAKLHPADLARFPHLDAMVSTPDGTDGKMLLQSGGLAGRWGDGLPLRAILVLRITGGNETRIVPATPPDAVKAMLTSLLMVLPSARRSLFEFTTRLAARVPVYRLELGRDVRQIAAAVSGFLAGRQP